MIFFRWQDDEGDTGALDPDVDEADRVAGRIAVLAVKEEGSERGVYLTAEQASELADALNELVALTNPSDNKETPDA
jgi:hypothetical protein